MLIMAIMITITIINHHVAVQVVCNPFLWPAFLKGLKKPPPIFSGFAEALHPTPLEVSPAASQQSVQKPSMSLAAVQQSLQEILAGQLGSQVRTTLSMKTPFCSQLNICDVSMLFSRGTAMQAFPTHMLYFMWICMYTDPRVFIAKPRLLPGQAVPTFVLDWMCIS